MTPSSNHLYDPTFSIETLRTFRYFHGYCKEMSIDQFRKKKSKRDLWSIFVFSMCLQINIFYACDHKFLYLGELIICLRILRTFEIASKLFIRYYETKSSGHHFDTQSFCFTPPTSVEEAWIPFSGKMTIAPSCKYYFENPCVWFWMNHLQIKWF